MIDLCLFGVAAHPRTRLLAQAFAVAGARLAVVDYASVLQTGTAIPRAACYKLDAPGQDEQLDAALLTSVDPDLRPREYGEVWSRATWYLGFAQLLARLEQRLPAARWLNPPDEVLLMIDKLRCQQALQQAGAKVPQLLGAVHDFNELVALMQSSRCSQVFLKSRFGSSASAVVALRRASGERWSACSSARLEHGRLYNHLRVRRLGDVESIRALVDAVCGAGAYAERWLPKPRVPGMRTQCYDLRVMCVAGHARQTIARLSSSPLTNLHLGNRRLDPHWLDPEQITSIAQAMHAVQRAFPRSHSMGVDLLLQGRQAHVLEVNAFGDLLHDVRFAGRSTYEDQLLWCQQ